MDLMEEILILTPHHFELILEIWALLWEPVLANNTRGKLIKLWNITLCIWWWWYYCLYSWMWLKGIVIIGSLPFPLKEPIYPNLVSDCSHSTITWLVFLTCQIITNVLNITHNWRKDSDKTIQTLNLNKASQLYD